MTIKHIKYPYFSLFFLFLACISADDNNSRALSIPEIYTYGQKYTASFYANGLDSLIECIVDKKYTIQNLRDFRQNVDSQVGQEINVLNERAGRARSKSNQYFYARYSRFVRTEQPVGTEFSFDSNDHIYQFSVEILPQEAPTHFLSYKTRTRLRLPFNGLWYVAAGGRAINTNHHAVATDQRFAYDFLIKKDGFSFQNDGGSNEDDFCYNQEIIAPGSGTIAAAVNDIPENRPGEMSQAAGNFVIIDHGNGEFSILAHLKQGSIAVKPGDKVVIGQFLGRCGNSGHSSQAHLHYHLQNSPVIFGDVN